MPVESGEAIPDEDLSLEDQILKIVKNCFLKYNNPTVVARKLGISRATVYRYLRQINIK